MAGKKIVSKFKKKKKYTKKNTYRKREKGEIRGQLDASLQGGMEKPGTGRWVRLKSVAESGESFCLSGNLKQS